MIFNFAKRNGPETEDSWLRGAIAGVVILAVCAVFVAIWVFDTPCNGAVQCDNARLVRIQIWAPFGVLAVTGITFATVVWRGLISARQADTGIRQIEGLQRQIALSEENNLATLMQQGAELISESTTSKQSAGIVSLEAVASAPGRKFVEPARQLLADYVQTNGHRNHHDMLVQQAIGALNTSFEINPIFSKRILRFGEDAYAEGEKTYWQKISGVNSVSYRNGEFVLSHIEKRQRGIYLFRDVKFEACQIDECAGPYFVNCTFSRCTFDRIGLGMFGYNKFSDCNFSGTTIVYEGITSSVSIPHSNFYYANNPPRGEGFPGDSSVTRWFTPIVGKAPS